MYCMPTACKVPGFVRVSTDVTGADGACNSREKVPGKRVKDTHGP